MGEKVVGVIGGSGLYELEGLAEISKVEVETPFGRPSDAYITGQLGDVKMVFLPRHGKGHHVSPSDINYRANIFGMKKLGVELIISVSAVGSMREDLHPGEIVVVDQFFDHTKTRPKSFFGEGLVCHVHFADPICQDLADGLYSASQAVGAKAHKGGTYLVMEGPQFSTRAESRIYRQWGVDVIGMTNLPEAKLAREAEICYATLALVTDYDCWHESEEDVSIEGVLTVLKNNVASAKQIIRKAVEELPEQRSCTCGSALRDAILSDKSLVPKEVVDELSVLVGRYF